MGTKWERSWLGIAERVQAKTEDATATWIVAVSAPSKEFQSAV
jgi:hypothetical protein